MTISDILSDKGLKRDEAKAHFGLPKRSKILVGVQFTNKNTAQKLVKWLSILPANFVVVCPKEAQITSKNIAYVSDLLEIHADSYDAILCDCECISLESIMKVWVVPIVNEKNYLWKILSEFHPGRGEGNSYLYQNDSSWSAYYALIRYLENHKFPYDNRNLVKNVVWI